MRARREVVTAVAPRYAAASKVDKGKILSELCAVTRWHRKHAIRALKVGAQVAPTHRRQRRTVYGAPLREALIVLWEASDRVCGKRLKVMAPSLLPSLERHGRLTLTADERAALMTVSAATIDRLLSDTKIAAAGGKRRRTGLSSAIRREVPVRTFNDWGDPPPGFCEVDMVAHGGNSVSGSFVQTLTMVDVATGWTECLPLVVREGTLVVEAIERAQGLFPWLLRGVDFDNDSAFMNDVVVPWCRAQKIEVTRSRAYKKNDQAYVEQKNGAVVRRLLGYGRFEGVECAALMARLFAAARLLGNFFHPSFKLKEKRREGAKVTKRYHAPATPYARALAHPALDDGLKANLRKIHATLDPVALLAEIRAAQNALGERVDRRAGGHPTGAAPGTGFGEHSPGAAPTVVPLHALSTEALCQFVRNLGKGINDGEHRKIHRRAYVRRRPPPRRPSILDQYQSTIEAWLAGEPHLTSVELLARLRVHAFGVFHQQHLRTVQCAVRSYRRSLVRKLVETSAAAILPRHPEAQQSPAQPAEIVQPLGNIVT
jgi:hypothetical protein